MILEFRRIFVSSICFFALAASLPGGSFDAQYVVEILEPTAMNSHRLLRKCEATGANFGGEVLAFSFRATSAGCAIATDPVDACTRNVTLPPPNGTETSCSTFYAVVPRGPCNFSEKAYYVQNATPTPYSALIVYNYQGKPIEPMGGSMYADKVTIPVVMVEWECMNYLLHEFPYDRGYVVAIKAAPGYYDLFKYLVPFGAVISFCLIVLLISLVIRVCRERRRLARKRLSRANLKKLPLIKWKKGMYETCAVCLEDFVDNEKLRQLPCKHLYHTRCVDKWLLQNRKVCPICKRKVGPSNGSDSSDSDSEQPTTTSTTSSISTVSQSAAAAIGTSSTQPIRDSVPLLRYEQPMATASNASDYVHTAVAPPATVISGSSRVMRLPVLALPRSRTRGIPRSSIEEPDDVDDSSSNPATLSLQSESTQATPRFLGRVRSAFRRFFTRTDYNPHTRLNNDFGSVTEEDVEQQHNQQMDSITEREYLAALGAHAESTGDAPIIRQQPEPTGAAPVVYAGIPPNDGEAALLGQA